MQAPGMQEGCVLTLESVMYMYIHEEYLAYCLTVSVMIRPVISTWPPHFILVICLTVYYSILSIMLCRLHHMHGYCAEVYCVSV